MQEIKQIMIATILGTLPLVGLTYLLFYFVGGGSIYAILEVWVLMMLIFANLLFLVHKIIPGGVKKWLPIVIVILSLTFVYPTFYRLKMVLDNRFFYYILGALTLLNLIGIFISRKIRN